MIDIDKRRDILVFVLAIPFSIVLSQMENPWVIFIVLVVVMAGLMKILLPHGQSF